MGGREFRRADLIQDSGNQSGFESERRQQFIEQGSGGGFTIGPGDPYQFKFS